MPGSTYIYSAVEFYIYINLYYQNGHLTLYNITVYILILFYNINIGLIRYKVIYLKY